MEAIIENQNQLMSAMEQLITNFKKDGASRKTAMHIKKRLLTLENYWQEFELNHIEVNKYEDRSYTYFTECIYDKVKKYYLEKREYIMKHLTLETKGPGGSYQEVEQEGQSRGNSVFDSNSGDIDKIQQSSSGQGNSGRGDEGENGDPKQENWGQTRNKGTNSKLDDMLRRQAANFKAFRRTVANINLETMSEKWEFDDVLRSLQSRWSAIDSLHWAIDSELCEENQEYEDVFTKYEQQFNNLKTMINKKMWAVAHREKSTPQMDIPIFSGNFNQWVSFKDLFNETIHNNPSLSSAQKMQFLKSKVRGEAERIIQHLPISSDNYAVCWEILNHRYNNKKLIFTSHIQILLNLPNMQHQSVSQIKKMHDVTLECLYAIKSLGVDVSTWDPILVHILAQKLDAETHADYIESLTNPRELPILQEFLDYMESKFTSLESSRRKQDNIQPKTSQQSHNYNNSSSYSKRPNFNQYNNNQNNGNKWIAKSFHVSGIKCPLCNNEHGLYNCKIFLEMPNEQKLNTVKKLKVCINCLFSHNGNRCISTHKCRKCERQHSTILHDACSPPQPRTSSYGPPLPNKQKQENLTSTSHVSQDNAAEILLATAMLKVQAADGSYYNMRALIDQGSQISLITERAAQLLGNKRQKCQGTIYGVGEKENSCKGMINVHCSSMYNDFTFDAEVLIMNNLIKNLPNKTFVKPSWPIIQNINLADPEFYVSRPVDLLLGADIYSNIILTGIIKGENILQPIAQQTYLGWLLCGSAKTYQCNVILNNLEDIQRFWEVEEIYEQSNLTMEDQKCIKHYSETTKRGEDGRYEVRLPMKENFEKNLGPSKQMAIAQFLNLERRLEKQNKLANDYKTFMNEYRDLHHMTLASGNTTPECYLPHHGIQRAESTTTKYRVVFNASAKTGTGCSLNDLMHTGPNLQHDLQTLLLKWRQYQYAFTADIEKMYRQILVNKQDQNLQKIIWRDSMSQQLQSYQLATVTYGTKAAPFLAMMTLRKLASDERDNFPNAAKILEESFYMDDLVHGAHSIEQGKELISDLIRLLKAGGFNLRKWSSNNEEIIKNISDQRDTTREIVNFKTDNTSKTLGLCWNSTEDKFTFQCNMTPQTSKPTKRKLLSEISKLFDPLGWIAPLTTKLKLLFQTLWKQNLQWDDIVSDDIYKEWSKIKSNIDIIRQYEIPRWIQSQRNDVIELHGFCDASEEAYASVVYAKINNRSTVVLVAAKTKLVPYRKALTLPRLELSGALLLAKLINKIIEALNQYNLHIYGWTDSMVVLGWLQGDPNRWKAFVANRVQKITQVMPGSCWRYVTSNDNPADAASRGMYATQLKQHALWWHGPSWLPSFKVQSVENKQNYTTNQEIRIKQSNIIQTEKGEHIIDRLLEKYDSFTKVTRVLAWILRALTPNREHLPRYITLQEMSKAKTLIVKHVQQNEYGADIECLRKQNIVKTKSKLLNLKPFIDQNGVLRVGGRLENANLPMETKHPAIIPHNSRLGDLLIDQAHHLTFHGGPRLTTANLRKQYWITGGNNATKKRLRKCVVCSKQNPIMQSQLMGDLPAARCNPATPFYHTGVDYTGHVDIKMNKGRGSKTTKGYIAIFVCMVTKAVHLELVSDMTSSAFLAALRRLAARRGAPRHLYSDCGTNFVGANRILEEEQKQLEKVFNDSFLAEVTEMGIEWHFNAPSWPTAGGLWERAVRSLKHHVRRVIGEQKLTFEEYATILSQIEACLNSRPLASLTEDIEDLDFLTPAHFLTGRSGVTVIQTVEDARTRWQLTNNIFQEIWKKWKEEYLSQLTARRKWLQPQRNVKVGDLVVIRDDNLPPGKWAMGRVVELHPGRDGFVRVVSLKTKNGYIKRPVIKLSVLPIEHSEQQIKDSDEENKNKQPIMRKKPQFRFASIAMALTFFMMLCVPSGHASIISELNKKQSLYFDTIAKMQLIRDKWTLVVYYDMSPYWEGLTAFEKLYNYLNKSCNTTNENNQCNMIVFQLRHEYSEVKYYNELLLTQHFRAHARMRRGLINGVGYVANSLFGVLDERFAEKYTKDIELLRKNQAHLNTLWRNQTSVVEAEYNLLKRTEENISKQHKIINKHLNSLDKAVNTLQQEVNVISRIQDFTLSSIIAINMLHNIKGLQDTLLDTITDIYQEQFNLHLLTPAQLKKELDIISGLLANDITLPITNSQSDLRGIYKLLKVNARMTEKYFIFEITIPLISRDTYDLYDIITIPQRVGHSMVSIIPIADHVAINLQKDSYLPLSQEDIQHCILRDFSTYICYLQHPIYKMKTDQDLCLKDSNKTNQCKIEISACHSKWRSLSKPNTYLYFCCDHCQLRTLCGDQAMAHQIEQTSVISIEDNCVIKTDNLTIHAHKQQKSTLNVREEIEHTFMAPINHIINITFDTQIENNQTDTSKLQLEKEIENKLKILKDNEAPMEQDVSYHDIHQYTLIYGILGAAAVTGVILLWRRQKAHRNLPAAAAAPAAAAGDSPQPAARQNISDVRVAMVVSDSESELKQVNKKNQGTTPVLRKLAFDKDSM